MIDQPQRQQISLDIQIAVDSGARHKVACHSIGLHPRTLKRWRQGAQQPDLVAMNQIGADRRPQATHPTPQHALSEQERQQILEICNSTEYSHLPPSQIVPKLADQGYYIASERSFYRILKQANQLTDPSWPPTLQTSQPTDQHPPSHSPEPNLDMGHHLPAESDARPIPLPV